MHFSSLSLLRVHWLLLRCVHNATVTSWYCTIIIPTYVFINSTPGYSIVKYAVTVHPFLVWRGMCFPWVAKAKWICFISKDPQQTHPLLSSSLNYGMVREKLWFFATERHFKTLLCEVAVCSSTVSLSVKLGLQGCRIGGTVGVYNVYQNPFRLYYIRRVFRKVVLCSTKDYFFVNTPVSLPEGYLNSMSIFFQWQSQNLAK